MQSIPPFLPRKPLFRDLTPAEEQRQREDHERFWAAANSPEQRRIAEYNALPKIRPPQTTLRECVIHNLSVADMALIETMCGSLEYVDTLHKVTRFGLWQAYRQDLKALQVRGVQANYADAMSTRNKDLRDGYRHMACMFAIFYLVRDASVRAEREALELAGTVATAPAKGKTGRL